MVGRKPALSSAQVETARASLRRRRAEPCLAAWARSFGVKPDTLRAAIVGRTKHHRSA